MYLKWLILYILAWFTDSSNLDFFSKQYNLVIVNF